MTTMRNDHWQNFPRQLLFSAEGKNPPWASCSGLTCPFVGIHCIHGICSMRLSLPCKPTPATHRLTSSSLFSPAKPVPTVSFWLQTWPKKAGGRSETTQKQEKIYICCDALLQVPPSRPVSAAQARACCSFAQLTENYCFYYLKHSFVVKVLVSWPVMLMIPIVITIIIILAVVTIIIIIVVNMYCL